MRNLKRPGIRLAGALTGVVTAVALFSSWHSGRDMWRYMAHDHRAYSMYTELERRHTPIDRVPLPSDVFDWYAERVHKGDRVYLQIQPGRARVDAIEAAFRFYLLPAVVVAELADANVIVSYFEDPAQLGVPLLSQERAGLQLFFVSRIERRG
jgi:hypothetical protein